MINNELFNPKLIAFTASKLTQNLNEEGFELEVGLDLESEIKIYQFETPMQTVLKFGIKELKQTRKNVYGSVTWRAAFALTRYLIEIDTNENSSIEQFFKKFDNKKCIELGAGTGLPGICFATLGGYTHSTDDQSMIALINENLKQNRSLTRNRVTFSALNWNDLNQINNISIEKPFDYILISDCVYNKNYHKDLYNVIDLLATKETKIILTYGHRDNPQDDFFELTKDKFIEIERKTVNESITNDTFYWIDSFDIEIIVLQLK
eukprot:TRINITY_DN7795_c0_g1_i1.p1 TRINITY_DN7795_c0_g1~~TRINITY_DN7795_c0_g1_i1.p1  ORF type:complete len:264 (+),score=100.34 TRINITY_DN7795_c0_g1_i1:91-882(+)